MPLEFFQIPDRVDAITEAMEMVVSDKATINGTGMAAVLDVLLKYRAIGGLFTSFGAPTPPSFVLDAIQTAVVIDDWEGTLPISKDVTLTASTGVIEVDVAGDYFVYGNVSVEYNVTDRIALQFAINGTPSAANSAAGFRNNQVDTQTISIVGLGALAATDEVTLEVFAESVGGTATVIAGQFLVSRTLS